MNIYKVLLLTIVSYATNVSVAQSTTVHKYTSLKEFTKNAYISPEKWGDETSMSLVGASLPLNQKPIIIGLANAPNVPQNAEGIETLLHWFMARKWGSLRQTFNRYFTVKDKIIYCDQAVSMFRTLLTAKGFKSRPMVFEYGDGYGAASHTFIEVWDNEAKKWLYTDPYYYSYSKNKSTIELVLSQRGLITKPLPTGEKSETEKSRKRKMSRMFKEGWHLTYIPFPDGSGYMEYRNYDTSPL